MTKLRSGDCPQLGPSSARARKDAQRVQAQTQKLRPLQRTSLLSTERKRHHIRITPCVETAMGETPQTQTLCASLEMPATCKSTQGAFGSTKGRSLASRRTSLSNKDAMALSAIMGYLKHGTGARRTTSAERSSGEENRKPHSRPYRGAVGSFGLRAWRAAPTPRACSGHQSLTRDIKRKVSLHPDYKYHSHRTCAKQALEHPP